jgi:poly-gamma-glutamate capsule biosynthesis protein CapA/YwtB (metallophosphatase superfamily)
VKSLFALSGLMIVMLLLVVLSPPPTGHSLKLASTGDIMLGRGVASAHAYGGWDQALAAFKPYLATADLAFANLESPITAAPLIQETYDLRAPSQATLALSASSIDILSLANNHIGDSGPSGVADTIQALNSIGVSPIGPDEAPLITNTGGIRLAWFAFDDTLQPLEEQRVQKALSSVRDRVDLTIVSIHWGSEFSTAPNERQHALAQVLAGEGADIILGHHPHVLQPVEWVWGTGRNRPTLVAYSLGNALFDQGAPPAARQGALLLLELNPLGVQDVCAVTFQIDPRTWNTIPTNGTAKEQISDNLRVPVCPEG